MVLYILRAVSFNNSIQQVFSVFASSAYSLVLFVAVKMVIKSDGLQEVCQTRLSIIEDNQILQSYEISPFKDSDNEDAEDEIRREKKSIPLWAR